MLINRHGRLTDSGPRREMMNLANTPKPDYEVIDCRPGFGVGRLTFRALVRAANGAIVWRFGRFARKSEALAAAKKQIKKDIAAGLLA